MCQVILMYVTRWLLSQKRRLFLTKQDYNSQSSLFGCSGHHELQLQTGDMVTVLGDVNSSGYYSVKFRSQRGLVHQSVLEEMDVNRKIRKRISDQVRLLPGS